jgi:hypothetical protein
MQRSCRWKGRTAALVLAAALLGGCIVVPSPGYYPRAVRLALPVPSVQVGIAPVPGYVWLGGYWNWVGGRQVWVGGHWGPR